MKLLEIKSLSKSYNNKLVLQNISFGLNKGEILAILGESGSGKTTLLHLIAGLTEPDVGELLLENKPIPPPSDKLIAGHEAIKLVRQNFGLFPNMSIQENIAYELRFYETKFRQKRIEKLLKISGLYAVKDKLPRQTSGGEQQRAVIIKAIAEQPKLLLLDEPFSHLDSRNKKRLLKALLPIIKADSVACIFVTHDALEAFAIADTMAIMKKGRFVQMGLPENIYNKPKNQYVSELTGEINCINRQELRSLQPQIRMDISQNTLFIRPEKLKIVAETSADFSAIVENVRFMGAYYDCRLKVTDTLSLQYYDTHPLLVQSIVWIKILD